MELSREQEQENKIMEAIDSKDFVTIKLSNGNKKRVIVLALENAYNKMAEHVTPHIRVKEFQAGDEMEFSIFLSDIINIS